MNRVSSVLGAFAVIAIAIVFVVSFGPGGGKNQLQAGPDCAANVLGNCIESGQFWATYRVAAGRLNSEQAESLSMKQRILDGLVERELLLADAKRLGVSVSDEEVTRELVAGRLRFSLPSTVEPQVFYGLGIDPSGTMIIRSQFLDKKTQKFSPANYKKVVTEMTRLSEADYREYQTAEIIAARMRDLIGSRVRISEGEAFDDFSAEKSTAKVQYVRLRPAFYVDRGIDRSDKAVAAWAEKNSADIDKAFEQRKKELAGECREASHMLIELRKDASEDDKKAAKETLEAAKKRVEADGFATVARQVSQDRGSRKDGGRLGCVPKGEMMGELKPFEDALFGLTEEGAVSDVVTTSKGMHLVRLDKITKGADAEKAFRARVARELYLLSEGKRLAAEGAKEIQAAVKGGKTLEDALAEHLKKLPADDLAVEPKKDEPKKDEPKKDEPKKDEPKKDEPKKDEPKKDEPKKAPVDPFMPIVETSLSFSATEEPFEDANFGETPGATAFSMDKPGSVAEKLIPLRDNGLAVMVLVEKKGPSDEDWQKSRDEYIASRRMKKQRDALVLYLKRLRAASQAEIKPNPEFLPKPAASGSAKPGDAPNPFQAPIVPEE